MAVARDSLGQTNRRSSAHGQECVDRQFIGMFRSLPRGFRRNVLHDLLDSADKDRAETFRDLSA